MERGAACTGEAVPAGVGLAQGAASEAREGARLSPVFPGCSPGTGGSRTTPVAPRWRGSPELAVLRAVWACSPGRERGGMEPGELSHGTLCRAGPANLSPFLEALQRPAEKCPALA